MSLITSFCALPNTATLNSGAINTNWALDASLNASNVVEMYIYITKTTTGSGATISSHIVVPKLDGDGNLTTEFVVNSDTAGMSFGIDIGFVYEVMLQIVYLDGSNVIQSTSSDSKVVMVSTLPATPEFNLQYSSSSGTGAPDQIEIDITNAALDSAFDGYNPLVGAFVTHSAGGVLKTKYFANDASNNVYFSPLILDACMNVTYKIAVSTYNFVNDASCNLSYGGRSAISDAKTIIFENKPSAPTALDVYETMRPLSDASAALYTTVSNTLTWGVPTYVGLGVNNFKVYRDNTHIATVAYDPSLTEFTYVDEAASLVAGTTYEYTVSAVNSNGEGLRLPLLVWSVLYSQQLLLIPPHLD